LIIFVLCLCLISAGFTSPAPDTETSPSLRYDIYTKNVVVEYNFPGETRGLELRIPYDAGGLQVSTDDYVLTNIDGHQVISVDYAEDLKIRYASESMIDKSREGYYFTSKNYLSERSFDVVVVLPESAILVEGGVLFPEPDSIDSDGRSVILKWDNYNDEQVLVNYEFVKKSNLLFYIILIILVVGFILYELSQSRKFKREMSKVREKTKKVRKKQTKERRKEELTKNLFEDEKRIVEYLLDKKGRECWTKELVRDLGISKVKLSRKLRSLERKEVIKKIPYGNENRIRLLVKR